MKLISKIAAGLFALAASLGAAQSPDWEMLTPKDESFTALMPGTPEYNENVQHSVMSGDQTLYMYTSRINGAIYRLGYTTYPPGPIIDPGSELQANRDNFIQGIGAQLIRSIPIRLQGVSGLDFTAENERLKIRSRVYFLDNRAIQLIVAVPKERDESANVTRFLESFRFSNRD